MKLRRKLTYLLAGFAVFVIAGTVFTIYSIHGLIEDSYTTFTEWMAFSGEVANLPTALIEHRRSLISHVRDAAPLDAQEHASHDLFVRTLQSSIDSGRRAWLDRPGWPDVVQAASAYAAAASRCVNALDQGRQAEAQSALDEVAGVADRLLVRLRAIEPVVERLRAESVARLEEANATVLMMGVVLLILAAALVVGGGMLIGRWLMAPVQDMQRVAEEFRAGRLDRRATVFRADELGQLAATLNTMAESLSAARCDLHVSEAKYRALFQNLRDAVILCDGEGAIVECHDGDTSILGVAATRAVGRRLTDVFPEWSEGAVDWPKLIADARASDRLFRAADVELTGSHGEGEPPVADLTVYPVSYGDVRHVAILLRDARERRRLQARVRQAEKMEAAGTLAGGVAHDFNNLLTSAIGSLSLIESEGRTERTLDRVRTALRACWQAAGLSRRLLRFAHAGCARPRVVRLAEVIELILGAQDEAFFAGLEVDTHLDRDVAVCVDKDELTQVVLNLLRNARDAMPGGGRLSITVDAGPAPPDGDRRGETFARLRVADTGVGMTPEVRRRIFEPFFTTKQRTRRRGTGMGMAVAYAVARGAGGGIEVRSEPGVGTEVLVFLPRSDGAPERIDAAAAAAPAPRGGKTVLLVDDDPMVLHTCTDALESLGCTVITAESVAEGQERFLEAGPDAVSLAVIDVALSDGCGLDLARTLIARDDKLGLVLMTGGESPIPEDVERRVLARLSKPFRLEALSAALHGAAAAEGGMEMKEFT
ncbi:MAG: HAMP domain-containing protein [Phycisphaerales bacterium]|nr:MAG: HAMP domain-containing protein [Phycisphaerales bacterium]